MRGALVALLVAAAALGLLLLLVLPLPPYRPIAEHRSPDGGRIARYAWKPAGALGLLRGAGAWVYVTILDAQTGVILSQFTEWADAPQDAFALGARTVPWPAAPPDRALPATPGP